MTTLKITSALIAERLDTIVAKKIPGLSRHLVQTLIKNKNILVNDKITKASYHPKINDLITIDSDDTNKPSLTPVKGDLKIIFEDKNIIILDKPIGLTVHPTENSKDITLAHHLLYYYPPIKKVGESPLRPGIVHRLDKLTSGVMVAAKNNEAFLFLKKYWQEGLVQKKYLALVWGDIKEAGSINLGITRSKRTGKMVARLNAGRPAITLFKPLKRYTNSTFLEVRTKTGRTHQIRVHFKSLGQPIVGDPIYPYKKQMHKKFPRLFLHASALTLPYPNEESKQTFTSPLPIDFKEHLKKLKLKK